MAFKELKDQILTVKITETQMSLLKDCSDKMKLSVSSMVRFLIELDCERFHKFKDKMKVTQKSNNKKV